MMKNTLGCAFLWVFLLHFSIINAQECGVWYVSPGGATAGTSASPASLTHVLNNVSSTDKIIRLLEGTYPLTQSLVVPVNGVIFDGGYRINGGEWVKSSAAATIINIDPSLETPVENGVQIGIYRGIIADNKTDFGFYAITFNVLLAGASATTGSRGQSIYGAHLANCNNYHFVRCVLRTGAASNGESITSALPQANSGGNALGRTGGAGGVPGGGVLGGAGRSG